MDFIFVYVTFASKNEAETVAETLLEQHLVSCANIFEPCTSVYRWKGQIHKATEAVCIFKSIRENYPELQEEIKKLHSYEVPCIVALPVLDGLPDFLNWIQASSTTEL